MKATASIGVFVVPRVPRDTDADRAEVPAPKADPGALALFAERLDAARMLATRSLTEASGPRPADGPGRTPPAPT